MATAIVIAVATKVARFIFTQSSATTQPAMRPAQAFWPGVAHYGHNRMIIHLKKILTTPNGIRANESRI